MPSILQGFEYDIFISYRHNDNRSGWVTEFVRHLNEELAATIKEPVSVYFDSNPHDGILETHSVDKSLEGKLKCLIFIPILSQTYCDPKSFAWQHEFCAFNRMAQEDQFGPDIRLQNGNVASRILPIKIHELDAEDKVSIEKEIDGALRAIDFTFRAAGVNRPLELSDNPDKSFNKTSYRDQVNKVANAIKELLYSLSKKQPSSSGVFNQQGAPSGYGKAIASWAAILLLAGVVTYYLMRDTKPPPPIDKIMDRAEEYLDEFDRFNDVRYNLNAYQAIQKALSIDSLNARAIYLMALLTAEGDTSEYFIRKLERLYPNDNYTFLARAGRHGARQRWQKGIEELKIVTKTAPSNKEALKMLCAFYWQLGDYESSVRYERELKAATGEGMPDVLSLIYLELGDFKEAERQLKLKQETKEFSCGDIEQLQRILLCSGKFDRLEHLTDSICKEMKCDQCAYWQLRAKAHTAKYKEALPFVKQAIEKSPVITRRTVAYILLKAGKTDSSKLVANEEIEFSQKRIQDTAYHQAIPYYSLAAIHAMQGDKSESLKWLRLYSEKGFQSGSEWYIAHDPLFDDAQRDPEYFADFIQMIQRAQARKMAMREKIREMETK